MTWGRAVGVHLGALAAALVVDVLLGALLGFDPLVMLRFALIAPLYVGSDFGPLPPLLTLGLAVVVAVAIFERRVVLVALGAAGTFVWFLQGLLLAAMA